MNNKITPVPWINDGGNIVGFYPSKSTARCGVIIAEVSDRPKEWPANAAFIVEACNNHDRLTEVNGELLAFAEATAKTFGADTMIAIEARAAIAKARKMGAKP